MKEKQVTLYGTNVAYELFCSRDGSYMGKTKRNSNPRLKKRHHGNATGNLTGVTKDIFQNSPHTMNFKNPKIIAPASHPRDILTNETLLIQEHLPTINIDSLIIPLHVFSN